MADTDKLKAALDFIQTTGVKRVTLRTSSDEEPTIWFVVATYDDDIKVSAGTTALRAALHLCEDLADGTICRYCQRRMGLEPELLVRMPYDKVICWYQYDPEMKTFRRGCE